MAGTYFGSMITAIDQYVIDSVREMRHKRTMSQAQLAYEIDVSVGFIQMIESGKYGKKYSVALLNEIATALDCSMKDFFPVKPIRK